MVYGALEAGGTRMVCATGTADGQITDRYVIPTDTPENTLPALVSYFKEKKIDALGIGTFGPVGLDPASPKYGHLLNTPKISWRNTPLVQAFTDALHIPVALETDVNAALLGELTFGNYRGIQNAVYYTIGTGIGAGVFSDGRLLHGRLHTEAGHILVRKEEGDAFEGCCPSHGDCLEGLASGAAIEARLKKKAETLAVDDPFWEIESGYLAQASVSTILFLSPEVIIFGGGVMKQTQLFPMIRKKTLALLNDYLEEPTKDTIDKMIVPASLHGDQGILGCLALAKSVILSS